MSSAQTFWARRRAGVAAESLNDQVEMQERALAQERAALEEKSDAEILTELDLPDPDTLQLGDNFAAFMAKAVPDRIRRRALRALWRSNPVLANVDMLVDYGEDFTDSATVVENMQTAYQVGKGMLKHVQEMARQAEELENPSDTEETDQDLRHDFDDGPDDGDVVLAAVAEPEVKSDTQPAPDDTNWQMSEEDDTYTIPTPRRMKFSIEESA
ncbi:DUF3306 domain-containing protein [Pseudohalocynthiibacter aestuariivivens]|nr:DUF3306 domain-containing protein [Pseudohalocynthiibacter aestuariivivens]QIE46519.1 DUF3306 domain-containing protein [Pseudohalocynthiibacter aestuariivivens]